MSKYLAVILTIVMVGTGAANLLYTHSSGDLMISGDYACFKYSEQTEYVHTEIYYSLLRKQFSFQPDSAGYYAKLNMFVEIKNDSGIVVDSSNWMIGNWIETIAEAEVSNYLINDMLSAQLKPGSYFITLKAEDINSDYTGELVIDVKVPSYPDDDLSISQIELVYSIDKPDSGNFDKAGKKLIPNTRGVLSRDDNFLYFYAEAYNLSTDSETYSVNIRVIDGNGMIYKKLPPMTQMVSAKSEVVLNGFNISEFPVGQYRLQLELVSGEQAVTTEKAFDIIPGKYDWLVAQEKRELSDFPEAFQITTEAEVKNFRNQILYIASREELRQYDELPLDAKSRFAEAFWQRRDPSPDTPINEYKLEHYQRIRYANEAYSTFRSENSEKNGWKTDRGRVYIEYGPPDDIENHPSSLEELPWVQWFYDDVDGGSEFIFIDDAGYDDYRLIHSTARGEHKNDNWSDLIRPTSAY